MAGGGQAGKVVTFWREGPGLDSSHHRSTRPLGSPPLAAVLHLKNDVHLFISLIDEDKKI